MKTNLFRNMRSVVCAALLALGATTAFATTETVEFADDSGMGTVDDNCLFEIIPSTEAAGSSDTEVWVTCDGTVYFNGTIPYGANDWRITSIAINGVRNADNLAVTCAVNGVSYTATTDAPYTFTGNTLSEGVVGLKLTGTGDFYFTTITIEYEQVSVPHITWSCSDDDDLKATSTVTLDFSEPMYINNTLISAATLALVSGEITLSDYNDNAVEKVIAVNSDKQIKVTTTGVKHCGEAYQIAVSELLVNSAGSKVHRNDRSDAQIAHEETIAVTGKGIGSTLYVGETFAPATDLVVTADGTDVTAECTFGNISTASAGTKTLTVTHGLCTKDVTITVTERADCVITWKNEVTNETLSQSTVKQGISLSEGGLTTLPTPATTVTTTNCGQKAFVGWSRTAISGSTDEAPTLVTTASIPNAAAITLYAVYADGSSVTTEGWKKITSVSELPALVGKQILIANTENSKVMGEKAKNGNNFTTVDATIATDGTLTPATGYTAVTLGGSTGAWTFHTDAGYLCAASSSKNYLKVQTTNDANGKWAITITSGLADVVAQGTYTRNILTFNSNTSNTASELFSCYAKTNDDELPTGILPINLYCPNTLGTGYITKCNCTTLGTPSNLINGTIDAESATLSWTAVSNASSYTVYYSTDQSSWSEATTTTNSATITGLSKGVKYYWKVKAHSDGKTSCVNSAKSEVKNFTTNSSCTWRISMQVGSTWDENICFTQVGTTTEWQYELTLPDGDTQFWVGPASGYQSGQSNTTKFSNITFSGLQNTTCNKPYPGAGAVGKLRIYSNCTTGSSNYCVAFIPTYQIAFGVEEATSWTHVPFAYVENTTYETVLTEIPSDYTSAKFYVGSKKTDGTVFAAGKSSTVLMTTMGGLNSGDMAGAKGIFRMYDNSCDLNWYCQFIPYYNVVYYGADNSTVFNVSDYISSEASDKSITIIATSPEKKGYRFLGWSKTANSTTVDVATSATFTLTKPNEALYPVFVQQVTLTYDANGGTSECGSVTYDINAAATLCTDGTERAGYRFDGWSTTKDDASTKVTTLTMSESSTLYALWTKYLTVTYNTTNLTLASGCEAVQADKVAGENVTLCGTPTSTLGYIFEKWIVTTADGTSTEYAAGAEVTLSSDITVQAKWDVPDITIYFVNQGAGTEYVKTVEVTVPQDTYFTAPTSVTVPTNCDGKVFVGWANIQIDDETTYSDVDALTAAGALFLSPGGKMIADNSTSKTWYAVFAKTE